MLRPNRLMTTLLTLATAATTVSASACPRGGYGGGGYGGGGYRPAPVYYSAPRVVHYPQAATPQQAIGQAQQAVARAQQAAQQARAVAQQNSGAANVQAAAAQAKAAFAAKNYGTALALVDQIAKANPKNNDVLQFRSLIRFAMGDYKLAAADAYEALNYGVVWDKKSLAGLYGNMAVHSQHLKTLKAAAADEPEAMHLQFLLAYENLVAGDLAAGQRGLEKVLEIKPGEPMAAGLLKSVKAARAGTATVASDTP